jgi:transcriptional regulator with XRE-family HTH domain
MANLAKILIEGRQRQNWSQTDLAIRSGVSVSTISRTEQGKGLPNVNSLRRIAQVLGRDPDELVRESRSRGPVESPDEVRADGDKPRRRLIPGVVTGDQFEAGELADADEPSHRRWKTRRVPHFGGVSAVRTELRETAPDHDLSDVPGDGVDFTVTVNGQCMEPRYEDGERLGCSIRRWEREGLIWNRDYWIRFNDGESTLKRVQIDPQDPARILCVPLNPKAKSFSRLKSDISSAARVVVVLTA